VGGRSVSGGKMCCARHDASLMEGVENGRLGAGVGISAEELPVFGADVDKCGAG